MIKSFHPSATVFSTNGERIIQAIKCIEHRELGDWYVDLIAPLEFKTYLQKDYILYIQTKEKGNQPFRINNPKITDKIDVRAYHVGFDTKNYAVELSTVVNGNAQTCLDMLSTEIDGSHPFTFTSAISTLKSFSVIDSSLFNALVQIADEYNGILDFDGWNISISSSIGSDNGVVLSYGKNIQESEINENWDLVVTKLKPIGNNGLLLTPAWLTADVSYDRPYTKIMSFDTDDVSNLALVAQLYLDRFKVPRVNYKVKADVEQNVALGDAVTVNARQFTTTAEVLSFDYNSLTNRIIQVEFGNFRPTLKQFFSDMVQDTENKVAKRVQVKIDELGNEIEFKVDVDGIITAINLSEGLTKILAEKIQLEGLVTANTYFKINLDGSMEATAGLIGRFAISGDDLVYTSDLFDKDYDNSDLVKLHRIILGFEPQTAYDLAVYDLNSSGTLSVTDLVILQNYLTSGTPLPTPIKRIRSVVRIGTDNGAFTTQAIAENGSVGPTTITRGEKTKVDLLNTNGLYAKTSSLDRLDVDKFYLKEITTGTFFEQGTFTPVLYGKTSAGAGTYTTQTGRYTKIGNVVHIALSLTWTAHSGTGFMAISGLPFTSGNLINVLEALPVNLTFSNQFKPVIAGNSTIIELYTFVTNAGNGQITMDTTGTLHIAGHYFI